MIGLSLMILPLCGKAQNEEPQPIGATESMEIIDSIAGSYFPWTEVSMSGKLSSPMLPLTASVKVYMVKDSLTLISISAPLIGEAARIEVDRERVLAVNKMSNKFATVRTEDIETVCPGGLAALQNLLLGRISLLGAGQLTAGDAENVKLYPLNETDLVLLPDQDLEDAPFVYFFNIDRSNLRLEKFTVLDQTGTNGLDWIYTWKNAEEKTIDLRAMLGNKGLEASLKLGRPDFSPKPMDRLKLTSKYKESDLKGLMR